MKTLITAIAVAAFTFGASSVYAGPGCSSKHACADGYTYSKEAGGCIKKVASS